MARFPTITLTYDVYTAGQEPGSINELAVCLQDEMDEYPIERVQHALDTVRPPVRIRCQRLPDASGASDTPSLSAADSRKVEACIIYQGGKPTVMSSLSDLILAALLPKGIVSAGTALIAQLQRAAA